MLGLALCRATNASDTLARHLALKANLRMLLRLAMAAAKQARHDVLVI